MKNLLYFLISNLVENPKEIVIDQPENQELVELRLKVHPDDLKIIIGKGGKTIRAIRHLLKIKAGKLKKNFHFILIEEAPKE